MPLRAFTISGSVGDRGQGPQLPNSFQECHAGVHEPGLLFGDLPPHDGELRLQRTKGIRGISAIGELVQRKSVPENRCPKIGAGKSVPGGPNFLAVLIFLIFLENSDLPRALIERRGREE